MSKYSQIFETLDTYKSIAEIGIETGIEKSTIQHYMKRLDNFGYVVKIRSSKHGHPFTFKRNSDKLTESQLYRLTFHKSKCNNIAVEFDTNEQSAMYNQILFGIKEMPTMQGVKVTPEDDEHLRKLHKESSQLRNRERKRQKVYIGSTFSMAGW